MKGLDESITHEDLYNYFKHYGEINSVKVATDEQTGKSKHYGFVWFTHEYSPMMMLKDVEQGVIPFICEIY